MEITDYDGIADSYMKVKIPALKRTIFINRDPYFLSFPEIVFAIPYIVSSNYQNFRLATESVVSVAYANLDKLYLPSLPNIDVCCEICMGDDISYDSFPSQEEFVKSIISHFWSSNFNFDIVGAFSCYGQDVLNMKHPRLSPNKYRWSYLPNENWNGSILGDFKAWAKKTKENPDWVPGPEDMIEMNKGCWSNFGY